MYIYTFLNVFWLMLIKLENHSADALGISSPASEFSRYSVSRPIIHHARMKREITSTRHMEGIHHPEVTLTLNIDGLDHVLDLRLNEDLIPQDHVIAYQENGETVLHKPKFEELDICQYSGKVRGKKDSWVAVSTCDGVRGVIHDGKKMRYIQPAESNEITSKHFIYDHSDLKTKFHCGYSGDISSNITYNPELLKHYKTTQNSKNIRYKREAPGDTEIRGPFNVNTLSRFVELVLVADNGAFRANGESIATVHRQMKDLINIVNSLYTPLNIFIALVGVVVWNERDEIHLDEDGDLTLVNFLRYRKELLRTLPNDNAHLFTNKPKRLFESSTCGNGFVEPGEQCDCGLAGDAACVACCHPTACVLRSNATCAAGECCDTTTCRPRAAGTVCRAADRECDLPEYCSGHSEYCPRDVHKMDTTPCAGDTAFCAGGSCRTHTEQCRLLWGLSGEMADLKCYTTLNTKGNRRGNCGYSRGNPTDYRQCSMEDALCGLLQCHHLNEKLEFGMESVSILSTAFLNSNGTIISCRTAMVDLGASDPDPGYVPDGAKCGPDKMCLRQRCVSAAAVRAELWAREPTDRRSLPL